MLFPPPIDRGGILLGTGIPVVNHLCGLEQLPIDDFRFFAVAAKVKGTFPVRAFATPGA